MRAHPTRTLYGRCICRSVFLIHELSSEYFHPRNFKTTHTIGLLDFMPVICSIKSESEKKLRDEVTFLEWGSGLTLDQYFEREKRLRAHAWSKESMQTWFLVDGAEVLSSCETFAMRSIYRDEVGVVYGVAGVCTEEKYRGKGYASKLITMICDELSMKDTFGLLLFSEVNPAIYERVGFKAIESNEYFCDANDDVAVNDSIQLMKRVDARLSYEKFIRKINENFSIIPTSTQLDWHFERQVAYHDLLEKKDGLRDIVGARVGNSIMIWFLDYKNKVLRSLVFNPDSHENALELIALAKQICKRAGFNIISFYDKPSFLELDSRNRNDSIAMFKSNIKNISEKDIQWISRLHWI